MHRSPPPPLQGIKFVDYFEHLGIFTSGRQVLVDCHQVQYNGIIKYITKNLKYASLWRLQRNYKVSPYTLA